MKLSCLPVSFFPDITAGRMSIREWAGMARSLGLDAFDLGVVLIRNHTPTYLASLRRDIREEGIGIAMITDYPDFTHPDPVQRRREAAYLTRDIALAGELGARFLRVTAGQNHPGVPVERQVATAVACLREAAREAEEYGVTLVLENHSKPGAWDHYDLTYDPAAFLAVADGIAATPIGLNFDTANAVACGADILSLLGSVADRVVTVHAADTAAAGEFRPVVVGSGAVPFVEAFRLLRNRGFDGWICIEEWSGTGRDGVARAVANMRAAWEAAAPDATRS